MMNTNGTYMWPFVTHIYSVTVNKITTPDDRTPFEVMTPT